MGRPAGAGNFAAPEDDLVGGGVESPAALTVPTDGGQLFEGLADEYRAGREHDDDFSSREVQVLDLLAQGLTNSEIADTLYLSRPVIERHLTKIFQKILPAEVTDDASRSAGARRENRRVLTVLEWLRRSGRLA